MTDIPLDAFAVAGIDPGLLLLLVAAAFVAGFIDSQVGGGGIITLPALLAAGLPPHMALGTNKLVATGASSTAAWQYVKAGVVDARLARWLVPLGFAGSLAGAWAVLHVDARDLRWLVLVVVVAMTIYVLARPRFGHQEKPQLRTRAAFIAVLVLVGLIGFYDGFLGPGTGSFLLFCLTAVWGLGFLRAAALGRTINFATNVAALILFASIGEVAWSLGAPMLLGTISGGYLGSRATIRGGNTWVRALFVGMAVVLAGKILWDLTA